MRTFVILSDLITKVANNRTLNLFAGLVLIGTAGYEIYEMVEHSVGASHGVVLYGVVKSLSCLPEIVEGANDLNKKV
ncbi:MAG: hypothetical protein HOJ88_07750 [Proteobacteria bacterium]|nr:hypothetical protein [Pseudomonadota bacterium]